jgi:hypothetical protein
MHLANSMLIVRITSLEENPACLLDYLCRTMRNSNTGGLGSTISPTTSSPAPPSSARSGSTGSSRASPRFTQLGASDLVLRNVNSGAFEVYDIANKQITGAALLGTVGLDWQFGGFAADPSTGAVASLDGSTSQLVQAMAGFGSGGSAADTSNTVPLGADTSQQPFLTTPQHAFGAPRRPISASSAIRLCSRGRFDIDR